MKHHVSLPHAETVAWHDRLITGHLRLLAEARDAAAASVGQLEAVPEELALIRYQHRDTELPVVLLHRGEHVARARRQLQDLISACSPRATRRTRQPLPGRLAAAGSLHQHAPLPG